MEFADPEHEKSFYKNEQIILADPKAKTRIRGNPGWWQMMLGGFMFASKMSRTITGTLYLTNRRMLFIRDLLKDDVDPKTTKERIQLRKDRELFQHLVGIKDIHVHKPRIGKPDLEVLYAPMSVDTKPFKFYWKVQDPEPNVWVEETKKLISQAKAPSKDDLKLSD